MTEKREFMKIGYDRSFVFRDSQGRMISNNSKAPKSKVVALDKVAAKAGNNIKNMTKMTKSGKTMKKTTMKTKTAPAKKSSMMKATAKKTSTMKTMKTSMMKPSMMKTTMKKSASKARR